MRTFDFTPLYRSAIGFDRLARLLSDAQGAEGEVSYPPYNVELISEDKYRIVMALAGFDQSELDIESQQQVLQVSGRKVKNENTTTTYLHRGIAARDFTHKFQLADHVKVTGASLQNGLLTIELAREVPEAYKPHKVNIQSFNTQELIEKEAA